MSASKVVMKIVSISFSILIIVLLIFGLCKAGAYAYDFGYRVYSEEPMEKEPGRDVVIEVEQGMPASKLGTLLEDKQLIRDDKLFAVQLKLSAYAKSVKAGVYTLNTAMTSKEMMEVIAAKGEDAKESSDNTVLEDGTEQAADTEQSTQTEVSE